MITCEQARLMIKDFSQDTLRISDLSRFIKHIENCPHCKEETELALLVQETMTTLNQKDGTYDIYEAVRNRIREQKRKIVRDRFLLLGMALLVCGLLAGALIFIFGGR